MKTIHEVRKNFRACVQEVNSTGQSILIHRFKDPIAVLAPVAVQDILKEEDFTESPILSEETKRAIKATKTREAQYLDDPRWQDPDWLHPTLDDGGEPL